MRITEQEKHKPRAYTNKLFEGLDAGEIDADTLARDLLCWVSEDTAQEFAQYYEYVTEEDEDNSEEV